MSDFVFVLIGTAILSGIFLLFILIVWGLYKWSQNGDFDRL